MITSKRSRPGIIANNRIVEDQEAGMIAAKRSRPRMNHIVKHKKQGREKSNLSALFFAFCVDRGRRYTYTTSATASIRSVAPAVCGCVTTRLNNTGCSLGQSVVPGSHPDHRQKANCHGAAVSVLRAAFAPVPLSLLVCPGHR